jgi:hypothetical protein
MAGRITTDRALRFSTIEFVLASIGIRIEELARRVGFELLDWEEDGLGPARGAAFRLPSGRPILLQELTLAVRGRPDGGPDVWVDAADLGEVGVQALVDELRAVLDVPQSAFVWVQEPSAQATARRRAKWVHAYRAARERGDPLPPFPTGPEKDA